MALAPIVNMWEVAGSRGKGGRNELILVFFLMLPSILFIESPFMDFILGEVMSPRASLVENREARMMGSALGRFCGAQRRTKRHRNQERDIASVIRFEAGIRRAW